jgi:hypothetical protein
VHCVEAQKHTIGYNIEHKTGAIVKYSTPYTRKSGDANTSEGNSVVNMAATYDVYNQIEIFEKVDTCLLLGDDNYTVVEGDIPDSDEFGEEAAI